MDSVQPPRFPGKFEGVIAREPLALYGWNGCPCTKLARDHFQRGSYCYAENVWSDKNDQLFKYLQCRYGSAHHSFVFIGGKFVGNGFDFDARNQRAPFGPDAKLVPALTRAKVRTRAGFFSGCLCTRIYVHK